MSCALIFVFYSVGFLAMSLLVGQLYRLAMRELDFAGTEFD